MEHNVFENAYAYIKVLMGYTSVHSYSALKDFEAINEAKPESSLNSQQCDGGAGKEIYPGIYANPCYHLGLILQKESKLQKINVFRGNKISRKHSVPCKGALTSCVDGGASSKWLGFFIWFVFFFSPNLTFQKKTCEKLDHF